jgi:hypothetical protein
MVIVLISFPFSNISQFSSSHKWQFVALEEHEDTPIDDNDDTTETYRSQG